VPVIEEKPVIQPSEVVLPATISLNDLTVEQWRVFYELIKAEEEDTLFTYEALKIFLHIPKKKLIRYYLHPYLRFSLLRELNLKFKFSIIFWPLKDS
jgi:hypothetical protein